MDPMTIMGVVSLGSSLIGGIGQMFGASSTSKLEQEKAQVSANTAQLEMQENSVRQESMEMSARRSQLETIRNTQRARAFATQAGVSQGAQFGSGMAGGLAEVTNEGAFGLQGINNNLALGRQMFGLDAKIDQNKIQMAQLGGDEASVQGQSAMFGGLSSLGGAMMKAGPTIGNIFKGFGGGGGSGANPFNVTGSLY